MATTWTFEEDFIVDENGDKMDDCFIAEDSQGGFVMGLAWDTYHTKNGKSKGGYSYYKVKSYKDLEHNEYHNSLTAVLRDNDEPVEETTTQPVEELYLYHGTECYGKVGTPTNLTDEKGNTLYVGDNMSSDSSEFRDNIVVHNDGEFFLNGLQMGTINMENGFETFDKKQYKKTGSYKDLKVGDKIDGLIVKGKEN